jgi:hypothetical protein
MGPKGDSGSQGPAGPPGPPGPAGPAGTTDLHALRQPACNTKCELICSVTCPGGRIHIEEIAESNSASCIGAVGARDRVVRASVKADVALRRATRNAGPTGVPPV